MDELLTKFRELAEERRTEIKELQILYLIKKAEDRVVQEQFNDICDEVLQSSNYCAEHSCDRKGMQIQGGDRITSHDLHWLMSENDFNAYMEICSKKFFEAGLTDEDGRYTEETDTEHQLSELKDKLVKLSVVILPQDFPNRKVLEDAIAFKGRNAYYIREKLFELIMALE